MAQQKTISENSDLFLTCSTFGKKKQIQVLFIYVRMTFGSRKSYRSKIKMISLSPYTEWWELQLCLLLKERLASETNFLPADISVAAPSYVHEGDDVAFRCIVSGLLQTLGECQLIHSYLMRNETILQVQAFHVPRMEANFIIEGAVVRDSGHYSCVVLPSKCIQEGEKTLNGNNAVFRESLIFRLIASFGVIALMILLGLCLWWINKQGGFASNSRVADQQADMMEEQQVQREGEDLDAQF
ncbi:hypothetical protein F7725_026031, partial [Dissostichus mawsoni]